MAQFALVPEPFPGHLAPMLALADALVARGHGATVIHQSDLETAVVARGHGFRAVGGTSHPLGTLPAETARVAALRGPRGARAVVEDVARRTAMLCAELPAALRALGADAVICDGMEAAGAIASARAGLPFASLAAGLPLNREPSLPPPFTGWGYDPSPWGLHRNASGHRVGDALTLASRRTIRAESLAAGLGPRERPEELLSPSLQLTQLVPGLDFPRREAPAAFAYVGPLRSAAEGDLTLPEGLIAPDERRPLVYASFGTLQGARGRLFARVAKACAALDLALVVAHGGRLGAEEVARLPGSPVVRAFVPQRAVLARAALCVSHAGQNTLLDALTFGVPVVALPLACEQGASAARLARTGAGLALTPALITAGRLERALARVLAEPGFAANAARLRAEIAAAGGVGRAADLVEERLLYNTRRARTVDAHLGAVSA